MFAPVANGETVYKTVDDEGNIIFSDMPSKGAEEIVIKEAQTIKIPENKSFDYAKSTKKPTVAQYNKLVITSPENDTTIHSNVGNVSVGFILEPALNEKDLMVLFMDEKQVMTGKESEFSLTNIDRCTHTLYVAVKDEKEKLLKRSGKVVFHVRRASILSQNRVPTPDVNSPDSGDSSQNTDPTPASPNIPGL